MMQYQPTQKQKGMSLLEVLIAMLIVGLGIGMSISMIQASNRYGESAENRAIAINEIQSIVSSMKSNPLGGPQYVWDGLQDPSNIQIPNEDCDNCSIREEAEKKASAQARKDLKAWLINLPRILPGGQAVITQRAGLYTVTVNWKTIQNGDSVNNENEASNKSEASNKDKPSNKGEASNENDKYLAKNDEPGAISLTFPL